MTKTATISEINTSAVLWRDFEHHGEIDGMPCKLTAIHGHDRSTAAKYEAAPAGSVLISVNFVDGTHRRAFAVPGDTEFALIPEDHMGRHHGRNA